MARFRGKVGFGSPVESAPGVWEVEITERTYSGDVVRDTRMNSEGENLNPDVRLNNSISIVADSHANENYLAIKYVIWMGVRWTVPTVEVQRPRLILYLGEVYHGPTG